MENNNKNSLLLFVRLVDSCYIFFGLVRVRLFIRLVDSCYIFIKLVRVRLRKCEVE